MENSLKIAFLFLFFLMHQANAQKTAQGYTSKTPSSNGTGKIYMGREIAEVMDFAGVSWLERNSRTAEENTALTIARLPLKNNSIIADVGAGSGFYTFKIASKVPQGKVYAVEIQDDAISYLKNRAKDLKASNVIVIKGTETSPNLPDTLIDVALMVDVYHELLHPKEVLASIRKSLKSKGKLILIEYKAEDPEVNIKEEHKMTVKQARRELEANGFKLVENGQFLPIQHFLVFEKSQSK
ncbi:MAG: methyltransferase domain-containing protein [Bacteroidota bacterium]